MYSSNRQSTSSIFDVLSDEVPLSAVLCVNGRGPKIHCIAHDEKTPSMHVYEDGHVHCFGCGFHGDVTDVWAKEQGINNLVEAAFDLAREFNVRLPELSPDAREKAEEKRKKQESYKEQAARCHDALNNDARVREWWETRGFDSELRKHFLLGAERGAAIVPFWHRGRIEGLIRRKLSGEPKYRYPSTEELGGPRPLFVPPGVAPAGEAFVVEGVIDALAVAASGRFAVAVGGTTISETQIEEMGSILSRVERAYILPDKDEAGALAAREWGRLLFPKAKICPADYGHDAKDVADAFAASGPEKTTERLMRLADASRDLIDIESEVAAEVSGGRRERLAYATKHIVPLLARIHPEGLQDATADIVAEDVKLKKSWLNKAIKDERERLLAEHAVRLHQQMEAEEKRRDEEYQAKIAEVQDEIDALFAPGVLERLRETAAKMHGVEGDERALDLTLLVALGAQLAPLKKSGRPIGASILLTAEAGRGKNHLADAAVKPLPEEFYFAFEIASGQSLYYKADEDPDFLHHTFAYPNEIEGAEALWEFLRPMLSKGEATKIVTAKDADGNMTTRTIVVKGPVTIAIPTIRNKTDEQLQTRLLHAELEDYVGRVAAHSRALSKQLLPEAANEDHSHEKFLWQEGLRQLTEVRRVVFPLHHDGFALDDDEISHGARLWANLIGLMSAHAWLEQKNRKPAETADGEEAIVATPDDYEAAYIIFNEVCRRTVRNISETHRKILDAVWALRQADQLSEGFTHREIAATSEVSVGAISKHRSFLVMSQRLLKETDSGLLTLPDAADPTWWASSDEVMKGLPTPEQVRAWYESENPEPPEGGPGAGGSVGADQGGADLGASSDPGAGAGGPGADLGVIRVGADVAGGDDPGRDHDHGAITPSVISESGLDKPNTANSEGLITVITPSDHGEVINLRGKEVKTEADLPARVVYVGREVKDRKTRTIRFHESIWHNHFKEGRDGTHDEVVFKFDSWVRTSDDERARTIRERLPELKGKTLACWCAPDLCHGHVLLELANACDQETRDHRDQAPETGPIADKYRENSDHTNRDQGVITITDDHTPNGHKKERPLTPDEGIEARRLISEGMAPDLARAAVLGEDPGLP